MSPFVRSALAASALAVIAACDTSIGTDATQSVAKSVVNSTVESRAPGVPVQPVTDCIIESASGSEIISIAQDGVDGKIADETVGLIIDISARPETVTCFIEDAGPTVATQIARMI